MKKYNVVLILLDGARIDRLQQSEEYLRLMKKGTFFSQMITAAPYTFASVNSVFTGMYGSKNGVDGYNNILKLKPTCKTLTQYLKKNGYTTCCDILSKATVNPRGFDKVTIHDEFEDDVLKTHKDIISENVATSDGNPFFIFFQHSFIHTEIVKNVFNIYDDFDKEYFDNKPLNSENYNNYFEESKRYAKAIYNHLNGLGILEDTLLIFFSDHGIGVGEKIGERAYGVFTYDYTVKTFAAFINEDIFPKEEISELTETIDIMPTILEVLNISPDSSFLKMQGKSLMSLIGGEVKAKKRLFSQKRSGFKTVAFSETGGLYGPWPSPGGPNVKCVRTKEWKLIYNLTPDTWELYNLKRDPQEETNVVKDFPKIVKKLKKELERIVDGCKKEGNGT